MLTAKKTRATAVVPPPRPASKNALFLVKRVPVIAHAVAVFGDEHKASHWLGTPLALLDDKSPSEVLMTPFGIKRVEQILTRIEHNIPS